MKFSLHNIYAMDTPVQAKPESFLTAHDPKMRLGIIPFGMSAIIIAKIPELKKNAIRH